jgi:hypothetical protein
MQDYLFSLFQFMALLRAATLASMYFLQRYAVFRHIAIYYRVMTLK